jgi:outer membrane autotransporter protein
LAGVSVGGGAQNFSAGGGSGHSDDLMLALYGRQEIGRGYLAAAYGHGWHAFDTSRTVTVSGTDVLAGKFDADDDAARIEAGVHLGLHGIYGVTPYAAVTTQSFDAPAYSETAVSGTPAFALSYRAHVTNTTSSELGGRVARMFAAGQGMLHVEGLLAWSHQFDDQPFSLASFASLPGSAFTVFGVRPATDAALLGLDLEMQRDSGLSYGIQVRGLTGPGTSVITGSGNLSYRW